VTGRGHPGPEIFGDLLLRSRYLRAAPLRLTGLGAGTSGGPPANGPAKGPGPPPLRGGRSGPGGGVPIPTVAASRDVGEAPKVPTAKMNEPTLTSLMDALTPDLVNVVSAFNAIVAEVAFGSVTVIVSPLIALTRPPMVAGTIMIDAATLEFEELGTTRTFSPSARPSDLAPGRRSVTAVVAVMEYANELEFVVIVIVELVSAVTSPTKPSGPRGGIGAGGVAPASFEPRAAGRLTGLDGCVDALATPMPLANTVMAIAEARPVLRRVRFREGCFIGESLSVSIGGFRNRNIFPNEGVDAIGMS
jgi:hypothetical protein